MKKDQKVIFDFSNFEVIFCLGDGTEESRDGIEEKSLVIDYESMEEF